ncbi:MAG: hypothetical protein V4671_11440, partial [Armatimonadota bacterium]
VIIVVVSYRYANTIQDYLDTWGTVLRSRIKIVYYEDLFYRHSFPRGAYIFTDLERLSERQLQHADSVRAYLEGQGLPVLNRPGAVLRRYELLQMLHNEEINPFRALRLQEVDDSLRYPVFLRREDDHKGPVSSLIQNTAELQVAVLDAVYQGTPPRNLLVVEFCDTADASGLYRKYSAFLIGDRYIPRHLLFSHKWMTKHPDIVRESEVSEELHYIFEAPHSHETQVRDIFQRASINYGRIDYALHNGRIVVWEINTNPTIATPLRRTDPARIPAFREVSACLRAAFEEVADAPVACPGVPLPMTKALREELGVSERNPLKQVLREKSRPIRSRLRDAQARLVRTITR